MEDAARKPRGGCNEESGAAVEEAEKSGGDIDFFYLSGNEDFGRLPLETGALRGHVHECHINFVVGHNRHLGKNWRAAYAGTRVVIHIGKIRVFI
jgi:hypothetical protein